MAEPADRVAQTALGRRSFQATDQLRFAQVSGDWNPMHLDPIAARRLVFGRCVVHGVNLVAWALDLLHEQVVRGRSVRHLSVRFRQPVGAGEIVELYLVDRDTSSLTAEVTSGAAVVMSLSCQLRDQDRVPPVRRTTQPDWSTRAKELGPADLRNAAGAIPVGPVADELYPHVPRPLLSSLCAMTRLVGMECPGLHSVFSSIDLEIAIGRHIDGMLHYTVARWDERFRRVVIEVDSAGATGRLVAFLRHPPRAQPSTAEIVASVPAGAFSDRRALVVGGSRGLGEVIAKALAAGGADVSVTYATGQADAAAVAADISEAGFRARAVQLDVLDDDWDDVARLRPTHLYYCATPAIFGTTAGEFFRTVYVTKFVELVEALAPHDLRYVLYPSSVAVASPVRGMEAYAAAKLDGEMACAVLEAKHEALVVDVPRLPRLDTDQTATFSVVPSAQPIDVILPVLLALGD